MELELKKRSPDQKDFEEVVNQNKRLKMELKEALRRDEESQEIIRKILDNNLKYADLEYDLEGKRLIIP